jgi:hypothetical protein
VLEARAIAQAFAQQAGQPARVGEGGEASHDRTRGLAYRQAADLDQALALQERTQVVGQFHGARSPCSPGPVRQGSHDGRKVDHRQDDRLELPALGLVDDPTECRR